MLSGKSNGRMGTGALPRVRAVHGWPERARRELEHLWKDDFPSAVIDAVDVFDVWHAKLLLMQPARGGGNCQSHGVQPCTHRKDDATDKTTDFVVYTPAGEGKA